MKVLCETCSRFIRYEPHDQSLKVTTEPCPHGCPPRDIERYTHPRAFGLRITSLAETLTEGALATKNKGAT